MREIKKGDIVSRHSYNHDIIFSVRKIIKLNSNKKVAILKGIHVRIACDAPVEDLKIVSREEQKKRDKELEEKIIYKIERERTYRENRRKEVVYTGRILHLDGDKKYSEKSAMYYRKMGLNATVKNIPENRQPKSVYRLLQTYNPDILVITRA